MITNQNNETKNFVKRLELSSYYLFVSSKKTGKSRQKKLTEMGSRQKMRKNPVKIPSTRQKRNTNGWFTSQIWLVLTYFCKNVVQYVLYGEWKSSQKCLFFPRIAHFPTYSTYWVFQIWRTVYSTWVEGGK